MAQNLQHSTIHTLSVGAFGEAVALALKGMFPDLLETRLETAAQLTPVNCPQVRLHIIAAWRMTSSFCHTLQHICYLQKNAFIPVLLNGPCLQVGPVVVPDLGPCYMCYEKRFFQHTPSQAFYHDLYRYYDEHIKIGPQGYLPAFADLAATKLAQLADILDNDPAKIAGNLWNWNIKTFEGTRSMVTGVHACPYCGLQRDESKRSYEEMRQSIARSFSWNALPNLTQALTPSKQSVTHSRVYAEERRKN